MHEYYIGNSRPVASPSFSTNATNLGTVSFVGHSDLNHQPGWLGKAPGSCVDPARNDCKVFPERLHV